MGKLKDRRPLRPRAGGRGRGTPRSTDKAPVTRTLDKKEVEDEVAEALAKLGHEPTLHELDGTPKSLLALARIDCDLVFNLAESFAGDDTADFKIAGFLELIGKRYTGSGTHGLLLAQDKAIAKKIFAFHGIHTPVFAKSFRGRLDFSHDLQFPVIVKPAREDGSIGIEFSAVVNSIRELMERMDWLHAQLRFAGADRGVHRGPRDVRRRARQRQARGAAGRGARPLEAARRHAADRRGRSEVGEGDQGLPRHQVGGSPTDLTEETGRLQQTAVAAYQALELRDYGRIDMRLQAGRPRPRHRGQPEPVAQFAGRVRHGGAEVRPDLHAA